MIEFQVDWDHWVRGAARFSGEMPQKTRDKIEPALDRMYDQTQSRVHVITGMLRASGRKELTILPNGDVEWAVIYGGDGVDYAFYEYRRGGSHDFMTEPVVSTAGLFNKAMVAAYEEVMGGWR